MGEQNYTDLGNAERLVGRHGAGMRHCAARRSWLIWDGQRWKPDATGEAMRLAKDVIRAMFRDAADRHRKAAKEIEDLKDSTREEDAERLELVKMLSAEARREVQHALKSEGRGRLEAMLSLAESEHPIAVSVDEIDAQPYLLNCQNGTLDLRTGELRDYRRTDLITKITPTSYDSNARDERWELFVKQIMPDDEVRRYVQKALGYSLLGTGVEGGFFLPYGDTHTGKTTLLEAVKSALGDYVVAMDVETLTGDKRHRDGGRARPDIVRLFGARLVISTEVPGGVKLDEALVKKLTGGDSLWARNGYEFTGIEKPATFVIWLGSNYRPTVTDEDDAIWQRVRQVPFKEQHTGAARDQTLQPYLKESPDAQAAVLTWLVQGVTAYHAEGLEAPNAVVTLTEDYRREMNPLTRWVSEDCDLGTDYEATFFTLRTSYEQFNRRGDRPVGTRRFQTALKKLPGVAYDAERRVWTGIRITPEHQEPSKAEPSVLTDAERQVYATILDDLEP